MTETISLTVENYVRYVFQLNSLGLHNIVIQGVPCPNIEIKRFSKDQINKLIGLIKDFNSALRRESTKIGFHFLDVHKITDDGSGFSNGVWHLDAVHLSPSGMKEAWRVFAS